MRRQVPTVWKWNYLKDLFRLTCCRYSRAQLNFGLGLEETPRRHCFNSMVKRHYNYRENCSGFVNILHPRRNCPSWAHIAWKGTWKVCSCIKITTQVSTDWLPSCNRYIYLNLLVRTKVILPQLSFISPVG